MLEYVKGMIQDFPGKLKENTYCPWKENLFKVENNLKKLEPEEAKIMHTSTMKAMFLCKRARQDIQPGVASLATRVRESNKEDWAKLERITRFLRTTQNDVCKLQCNDTNTIKWYVDVAFAVHKDMKSHTGGVLTLGKGSISSDSWKQKVKS